MPKVKPKIEKNREKRINDEIIVDAYGEGEQAMAWYNYLEENLHFPFAARCIAVRAVSPLEAGDKVDVTGMAPENECESDMFVMIRWGKRGLAVPLSQLKEVKMDKETKQALGDWHYWVKMGHEFW